MLLRSLFKILYGFFALLLWTMTGATVVAQQVWPLYEGEIQNSIPHQVRERMVKREDGNLIAYKVSVPTLTIFKAAEKQATSAVIICPGGGYGILSMRDEGTAIGQWFAEKGVTAFVLKYRLPDDSTMKDKRFGPMMDAQQAILQVRLHAKKWNIDPNKIGILGFSAGGHLASTLLTHYDDVKIENPAKISLKPNFSILAYPVITFGTQTHGGTRGNLIGADSTLVGYFSAEKNVNSSTSPTFIMHAQDDASVPILENSVALYQALVRSNVKTEFHVFQAGGHGFGAINPSTKQSWLPLALEWLHLNGF